MILPQLIGMLACVAGILALAYWVTRLIGKYGASMYPSGARMGELCVLRQIPVGRAERLVLVRLHQKCLLLGVAQGGVSVLAELSEEDSAKWLEAPQSTPGGDFFSALRGAMKK